MLTELHEIAGHRTDKESVMVDLYYDYLVLGCGSEPAFFGVEGVKEYGLTIWSLKDPLKIREHIEQSFQLAKDEKNAAKRKELQVFLQRRA